MKRSTAQEGGGGEGESESDDEGLDDEPGEGVHRVHLRDLAGTRERPRRERGTRTWFDPDRNGDYQS